MEAVLGWFGSVGLICWGWVAVVGGEGSGVVVRVLGSGSVGYGVVARVLGSVG